MNYLGNNYRLALKIFPARRKWIGGCWSIPVVVVRPIFAGANSRRPEMSKKTTTPGSTPLRQKTMRRKSLFAEAIIPLPPPMVGAKKSDHAPPPSSAAAKPRTLSYGSRSTMRRLDFRLCRKFYSLQNRILNSIRAVVICGPSGSGKTTLLERLLRDFSNKLKFSISYTTRKPRPNEREGQSYHFVDKATFKKMIANNELVEYAKFSGNYYGTSMQELVAANESGYIAILDVDLRGVINLQNNNLQAKYIFIKPPSLKFLENNLRKRRTESESAIKVRLRHAQEDLKQAEQVTFNLIIENVNLDDSYQRLSAFIQEVIHQFERERR